MLRQLRWSASRSPLLLLFPSPHRTQTTPHHHHSQIFLLLLLLSTTLPTIHVRVSDFFAAAPSSLLPLNENKPSSFHSDRQIDRSSSVSEPNLSNLWVGVPMDLVERNQLVRKGRGRCVGAWCRKDRSWRLLTHLGMTDSYSQMNRLKFTTSGELPTILEESI